MGILQGDALELMPNIPDGSIDLTITSPPYDNLRTYNDKLVWNWDVFTGIADQLWRVTKKGGVIVWVVGDATIKGSETGTSFRQALYFKDIGLNLHDTMIWSKGVVAFPESNRYNNKMEYMFVFSKGTPKTFNGIKDHKNVSVGRKVTGKDRVKDGGFKERSGLGNTYPTFSLRGNVWKIWNQSRGKHTKHPATFPEQLANDHIISWSNEGDTVLDPMMGSGTTGKMAKLLNRNFIGIEKDPKYFEIAKQRIKNPDYTPPKPTINQQPGLLQQDKINEWTKIKEVTPNRLKGGPK